MGAKKFPKSAERSPAKPVAICPADRVLDLYNRANDAEAKRIGKTVRAWFTAEAHADGWDHVGFVPQVESEHGAGAVLIKKFGSAKDTLEAIGNDG